MYPPTKPHLLHPTPFSLCLCPAPNYPPSLSLPLSPSFSPHLAVSLYYSHTYSTSLCFLTTCPFLSLSPSHPPSICPAARRWYELMCQLSWSFPPAAVCQTQLSSPHVSLWLFLPSPLPLLVTLTASLPLSTIFHSIMSAPPFLLSRPFPSHLCSNPLFYFPPRQACQEDSATCPRAVWCCSVCVCVCVCACYIDYTFVFVCEWQTKEVRERVCVLRMTTAELFLFDLEADMKGIKSPEKERH